MFLGTSFHVIQKSSWDINIFQKINEIALWLSLPGTQGILEIFMEHCRDEQADTQQQPVQRQRHTAEKQQSWDWKPGLPWPSQE